MKKQNGLTLVELMVTLAVMAILLFVAAPQMGVFTAGNKLTVTINDLLGDMDAARNEARTRNTSVRIKSNNGTADWSDGWTIELTDAADGTDIQVIGEIDAGLTLNATNGLDMIVFTSDGRNSSGVESFLLCRSGETGSYGKGVSINVGGSSYLLTGQACP